MTHFLTQTLQVMDLTAITAASTSFSFPLRGKAGMGAGAAKIVRIKKLTSILLLTACLTSGAAGHSQQVTIKESNASLKKIFQLVTSQTGYLFFYTDSDLNNADNVSINVKDAPLEQVLNLCFKDQPLTYSIIEKTIVVKQKLTTPVVIPNEVRDLPQGPPPIDITGRITNVQGEPLSGASVIIKRTGKGDIADANGKFKINNVNADDVIEISYTGYKTQSLRVGDRTNFALILDVAVDELDKVQIQAYGKTSRRLSTGNIVTVTKEEIERQPVMNPLLALQGKVAGLEISQTNGFASAPIKVELRGRNTIGVNTNSTFPSDPLYIIDGVPLTVLDIANQSSYQNGSPGLIQSGFKGPAGGLNPLFVVNPTDIESIDVLKDADATAIYGSRGANGVIIITTKRGEAGKPRVDVRVQQGITKVTRYWKLMNTQQYLQMRREALSNDGITPSIANGDYDLLQWDTTRYTDWQRVLYGGTGKTVNAQMGLLGGGAQTNFRLSGNYSRTTNILTVSGADQRGALAMNFNYNSQDHRFGVSFLSNYSISQSDMINIPGFATLPPNAPAIYDSIGNLNFAEWGGQNSTARNSYPFTTLKQPYTSKTNFLNNSIGLNFRPLRGLHLSSNFGYSYIQTNQQQFSYKASLDPLSNNGNPTGRSNWGYTNNNNWIIEPQASYETRLGKAKVTVLVGGSIQVAKTNGLSVAASGYTSDNLVQSLSGASSITTTDFQGVYRYAALFSRITYNWENKYILNLNARRDGSSRFGANKQFGNFGSAAIAWIFTEENWFKNKNSILSFGKIRASYGTTGSDAIGDYKYLTRWSSSSTRPYNGSASLIPTQLANPDFQWQVNKKMEAGLDLGFFKDKLSLGIVYYRNRCGNQLIQFPTPATSGYTSVAANSPALVQNAGLEISGSVSIIQLRKFNWSMSFNLGANRNKLVSYPDIARSPFASTLAIGKPLNIVKILHYTGIDPLTGEYSFEDRNHDGFINNTSSVVYAAVTDTYARNLSPEFLGGCGMNVTFHGVVVNLFFNFSKQIGRNSLSNLTLLPPGTIANQPAELLGQQWQKPGDKGRIAKFTTLGLQSINNLTYSDFLYTDASYLRLSNLAISYDLPTSFIKRVGIQKCNLFLSSNNLFLITKYKGTDPETRNYGGMPPNKTIVGGLNFNF